MVIDLESLYNLLRDAARVHVHLHTFLGAALVGLVVSGVMVWGSRFWNAQTRLAGRSRTLRAEVSRGGIFAGAMLGALTHPILDGMMHSDIRPFAPFSRGNPFYLTLDIAGLHTACVVAGLVGLALVVLRRRD